MFKTHRRKLLTFLKLKEFSSQISRTTRSFETDSSGPGFTIDNFIGEHWNSTNRFETDPNDRFSIKRKENCSSNKSNFRCSLWLWSESDVTESRQRRRVAIQRRTNHQGKTCLYQQSGDLSSVECLFSFLSPVTKENSLRTISIRLSTIKKKTNSFRFDVNIFDFLPFVFRSTSFWIESQTTENRLFSREFQLSILSTEIMILVFKKLSLKIWLHLSCCW